MAELVGSFKDEAAGERFAALLDKAMASWPERDDCEVTTAFGSTAVSITRESGQGVPLVLLPGGASTIAGWAEPAEAWRADRPVVAIDTVWDAGRSVQQAPVADGPDAAAWLEETLSGLGLDSIHLLGFSYGGWAALNQAVERPGRLRSVTALEPVVSLAGMPLAAWWQMLRMLSGDPDRCRAYLAWVRRGRLPAAPMLDLLLSAQLDFVRRGTPRPRRITPSQWRQIAVPLMVVLGEHSPLIPSRAAGILRRRAPTAELHVLPGTGHTVTTDAPEATTGLVADFLVRHDGHDD